MDDMNCWAVSAVGTYKLISIIQTIAWLKSSENEIKIHHLLLNGLLCHIK
jgi:hypothetical protein